MRLFIAAASGVVIEAPPLLVRRAAVIADEMVTVPLPAAAQEALRDALASHMPAVRVALAPFGLCPWDIAMPTFRRVLREDEMKGQG